jgi:hypothetical protein
MRGQVKAFLRAYMTVTQVILRAEKPASAYLGRDKTKIQKFLQCQVDLNGEN